MQHITTLFYSRCDFYDFLCASYDLFDENKKILCMKFLNMQITFYDGVKIRMKTLFENSYIDFIKSHKFKLTSKINNC